jgi:hypothetical protein
MASDFVRFHNYKRGPAVEVLFIAYQRAPEIVDGIPVDYSSAK